MDDENKSLRRATRIYEALLWFYPRAHRHEYGSLMLQHFRDQYRAVCRRGNNGGNSNTRPAGLWLRTLADLLRSAFLEQLNQQTQQMKTMPPAKLSLILFVIAIGAMFAICPLIPTQPGLALGLAYFATLVLLARAIVEWSRPAGELVRSLAWGAIFAVILGFLCPLWRRFNLPFMPVAMPSLFLTGIVPLLKTAIHLARGRR
jgi:hypothetical protein